MHFFFFNALRKGYIKFFWFSKIHFFYNFDQSSLFFDQSKLRFKNFSEPLPGLIDRTCFSINRTSWIKFFLNTMFDSFKTLFQTFLSLSDLARLHWGFFVVFNQILCKVFLSQGRPRSLYPSFFFYFHDFMHKLMHFNGIFGTFHIWDFCWINPLFLKLIIGFYSYIVIFMIYVG